MLWKKCLKDVTDICKKSFDSNTVVPEIIINLNNDSDNESYMAENGFNN